ncbi:MAG: hypothetical protein ABW098_09585 [Candidatus Thiodiazotropha sp.]
MATAKRFLHNVGAGELAMVGFQSEFEKLSNKQPGMSELVRRAFADFKAEDFEDLAAQIYARHLSHAHLLEIAQFSEKPAIDRFFEVIFSNMQSKTPLSKDQIIRQFNADELSEIVKFSQSESFIAMNKSLPKINRELSEAARKLGETKIREYIDQL